MHQKVSTHIKGTTFIFPRSIMFVTSLSVFPEISVWKSTIINLHLKDYRVAKACDNN